MPSRRFDTYLFDLDGTLLDSIELIFRCYRHAAQTHMGALPPDKVWLDGLGTPLRQQFSAVSHIRVIGSEGQPYPLGHCVKVLNFVNRAVDVVV